MDKNAPVASLRVDVIAERGFPITRVTLDDESVESWTDLRLQMRAVTPNADYETVLRAVILYGTRAVTKLLADKQVFAADGRVRTPAALKGKNAAAALAATRT
jgi:hypothetical protein